jgi:hypothetical protein
MELGKKIRKNLESLKQLPSKTDNHIPKLYDIDE